MKATSKLPPPHPSAASEDAWVVFNEFTKNVRVFLTFLEVCKFTTFCDRKGYWLFACFHGISLERSRFRKIALLFFRLA